VNYLYFVDHFVQNYDVKESARQSTNYTVKSR